MKAIKKTKRCLLGLAMALTVIYPASVFSQIAVYDFTSDDGGFEVSSIQPNVLPGPFEYNADRGTWVNEGGATGCDPVGPYDSVLTTPEITAPASEDVVVELSHRYAFEPDASAAWDIGQIRVSINGGEFVTVPASSFLENGYFSKPVAGNGIMKGLLGFSGQTEGFADGAFITSKAIIGTMAAGDKFKVQFVAGHDECATGAKPNWEIDRVAFDKRPPIAVYDFASDDGGFEVSSIQPNVLPGPFEYNADKGTWVNEGGATGCDPVGPYDSVLTTPEITAPASEEVVV